MSDKFDRSHPRNPDAYAREIEEAAEKDYETDPKFRALVDEGLVDLERRLLGMGVAADVVERAMRRDSTPGGLPGHT